MKRALPPSINPHENNSNHVMNHARRQVTFEGVRSCYIPVLGVYYTLRLETMYDISLLTKFYHSLRVPIENTVHFVRMPSKPHKKIENSIFVKLCDPQGKVDADTTYQFWDIEDPKNKYFFQDLHATKGFYQLSLHRTSSDFAPSTPLWYSEYFTMKPLRPPPGIDTTTKFLKPKTFQDFGLIAPCANLSQWIGSFNDKLHSMFLLEIRLFGEEMVPFNIMEELHYLEHQNRWAYNFSVLDNEILHYQSLEHELEDSMAKLEALQDHVNNLRLYKMDSRSKIGELSDTMTQQKKDIVSYVSQIEINA